MTTMMIVRMVSETWCWKHAATDYSRVCVWKYGRYVAGKATGKRFKRQAYDVQLDGRPGRELHDGDAARGAIG